MLQQLHILLNSVLTEAAISAQTYVISDSILIAWPILRQKLYWDSCRTQESVCIVPPCSPLAVGTSDESFSSLSCSESMLSPDFGWFSGYNASLRAAMCLVIRAMLQIVPHADNGADSSGRNWVIIAFAIPNAASTTGSENVRHP